MGVERRIRRLCLCQRFSINLQRCSDAVELPRSGIELPGNSIQIVLAVAGQILALGQILAQQPVGVLVRSALPRTAGFGEEHRDARAFGQAPMFAHLLAQVIGQGLTHRCGDAVQDPADLSLKVMRFTLDRA